MSEMEEVVKDFLVESNEAVDQLDRDLLALEQDPQASATLASVFRAVHTIKGTCGFLGFNRLESLTHVGENLLSRLRDGEIHVNERITSALLALVDAIRQMLANIEDSGQESDNDYEQLKALLSQLQDGSVVPAPAPRSSSLAAATPNAAAAGAASPTVVEPEPDASSGADDEADETAHETPAGNPFPARSGAEPSGETCPKKAAEARAGGVSDANIRVDVGLLDRLMNQVGELVLARNQILQFTTSVADPTFQSTTQRLNLITTELQEGVMKTRMQPIGNIWMKFPRVVRDLAVQCGKQVRIEMEGKETELDKTIIEAIKDPLTHLVRNAVDHGIENLDRRAAAGKPAEGRITLRAFHEGGQVNIEISDDGAGLDVARIAQKAIDRGLVGRDAVSQMSDRELVQLIFLPGFSTAEKVSNVSGRGVGMDVVKTNIEKIGGSVDVKSQAGQGTSIKIKIPLTLAIIPALIVTCQRHRFAIPQVNLMELVRLEGAAGRRAIESVHGAPVYRLRGRLLPLVYLDRELGFERRPLLEADHDEAGAVNIVVLRADDRQFGLVVDAINDTEEIVVKPLGKQLKGVPCIAGATIMGDGRVALILDVLGIAQHASVLSAVRDRSTAEASTAGEGAAGVARTLLLVGLGSKRRLAVPLSVVARLEEIPTSQVEIADEQEVVQYRGQILPLLRLGALLGQASEPPSARETLPVVVYSEGGASVGVVVDRVIDIVETTVELQHTSLRPGILGAAVIQQCVTDVLDLSALVRAQVPLFTETMSV